MGVPTNENTDFKMFGHTDNTTIQGAIKEGGTSSQINSANKFSQLIPFSNAAKFDSLYAGVITNTNQVTCAEQYRGYPASSSNNSGLSSFFGNGNLIGHFGSTGSSTLSWKVNLQINGYSSKNVTIGPSSTCFGGCGYTSAARVSNANDINGSGSITVTRMADSSSNSNNQVNDDGDVQLVITEGTSNSPRPGISSSGSPNRYDLTNGTYRRANYTFTAGQTFSKTFVFTNLLVADGDTFQLDITEG